MNYELAQKLKNSGFPQGIKLGSIFTLENEGDVLRYPNPEDRTFASDVDGVGQEWRLLRPSLSELIAACEGIYQLECGLLHEWTARGSKDGINKIEITAKTIEEAVANLWLALNKK